MARPGYKRYVVEVAPGAGSMNINIEAVNFSSTEYGLTFFNSAELEIVFLPWSRIIRFYNKDMREYMR